MPLIELNKTNDQCGWAIWRIEETESQLAGDILGAIPDNIIHPQKRLEWFAARTLTLSLSNYLGLRFFGIRKDEFGKPLLEKYPHHLSLSHSYPYVAVQINKFKPVGIDLEQPKEKLLKVAPRVLSNEELIDAGTDIVKHCIYWCAKEALYKLDGKGGLHFSTQLLIKPFERRLEGLIKGRIHQNEVELGYQVNNDFVVVYTAT
jgi:phosphopantetheinyl transferase